MLVNILKKRLQLEVKVSGAAVGMDGGMLHDIGQQGINHGGAFQAFESGIGVSDVQELLNPGQENIRSGNE
ncbi:hypothetical protein D3C75_784620 [compost metagenome]